MDTQGNIALSRPTQPQSPNASSPPPLYERLAVARLQYTVNELQTKVDFDRRLAPPVRKVYHCVTDDSALVQSIGDFKRWTGEGIISMLVPLCTLDALDDLKKGTDMVNVNSRESVRYFDRCQSGAGRKPVRGVRVQAPTEVFAKWEECAQFIDPEAVVPAMPPPSPPRNNGYYNQGNGYYANSNGNSNGNGGGNGGNKNRRGSRAAAAPESNVEAAPVVPTPPKWVQPILNCALYKLHQPGKEQRARSSETEETVLVTHNETVAAWAKVFSIKAVDSDELADLLDREGWEFAEKTRVYNANLKTGSNSNGRNSGGGRGGRNGGGRGGHRRDSTGGDNVPSYSPGGGSGRGGGDGFVLRGAPRGVARGRGKLWEP
ncbi:uncharacterized protein H6S33_011828 [Morchella sextelata]|uniref:uncharacterized protein n=1 Tax=Morchella sextelata TaxID=1174677 RepID=UPI001D03BC31|nr:uncharacterized protein H6S33_011828 [Morchella sextelata]KAH0610301.1 hypothetical protein H6S33_011828 [Morchella sextelata]